MSEEIVELSLPAKPSKKSEGIRVDALKRMQEGAGSGNYDPVKRFFVERSHSVMNGTRDYFGLDDNWPRVFSPVEALRERSDVGYEWVVSAEVPRLNTIADEEARFGAVRNILSAVLEERGPKKPLSNRECAMLLHIVDCESDDSIPIEKANYLVGLYVDVYEHAEGKNLTEQVARAMGEEKFVELFGRTFGEKYMVGKASSDELRDNPDLKLAYLVSGVGRFFHGGFSSEGYKDLAGLLKNGAISEVNNPGFKDLGLLSHEEWRTKQIKENAVLWVEDPYDVYETVSQLYTNGHMVEGYKKLSDIMKADRSDGNRVLLWSQIQKIGTIHTTATKAAEIATKEPLWSERQGLDLYFDMAEKYFHGNLKAAARTINGLYYAGVLRTDQMFAWDELEFAQPLDCKIEDIRDRGALEQYIDIGFPGSFITTHTAENLTEAIARFPVLLRAEYSHMTEIELIKVLLKYPDADIASVNNGLAVIAHNASLREYYRRGEVDMTELLRTVGGLDLKTAEIISQSFKRSTLWKIVKDGSKTFTLTVPELLSNPVLLENSVGETYRESQEKGETVLDAGFQEKPPAQSLYEEVMEAYEFNPAIGLLMTEILLADNFDDVERVVGQYDSSIDDIAVATKKLSQKVKRGLVRWSKFVNSLAQQRSMNPESGIV